MKKTISFYITEENLALLDQLNENRNRSIALNKILSYILGQDPSWVKALIKPEEEIIANSQDDIVYPAQNS